MSSAPAPHDFCGIWRVEQDISDSIEPMLKAMGVGWKIRKIVTMLKVLQQIEVHDQSFVVRNISQNGEDTTTHQINAGEQLIRTKRGDEVIDECTFDPRKPFPLRIFAVLPHGKGSTEDLRKLNVDKSGFEQVLIYKYPPRSGKPDIIMRRFFSRADTDPLLEQIQAHRSKERSYSDFSVSSFESQQSTQPPSRSVAPSSPSKPHALQSGNGSTLKARTVANYRVSSNPETLTRDSVPSPQKKRQVASVSLKDLRAARDKPEPSSTELWVAITLAVAVLIMMFFALAEKGVNQNASPFITPLHALFPMAIYVGARIFAQTKIGKEVSLYNPRLRWAGVVFATAVSTLVYHYIGSQPVFANNRVYRLGSIGTAIACFVVARTHAGLPSLEAATSMKTQQPVAEDLPTSLVVEAVSELSRPHALGLSGMAAISAVLSSLIFGESHTFTVAFASISALIGFAVWYIQFLGFERQEPLAKEQLGETRTRKRVRDREGKTLKVAVVGHRIVDDMYAQHKVRVEHEGLAWYVWRRFSQFDTLRHELRRMFGHGVLPQLPGKTWFSVLEDDFLEQRTQELDEFIRALMDDSLRKQVFKVAETRKFLGIGQGRGKLPEQLDSAEEDSTAAPPASAEEMKVFMKILKEANAAFEKAISVGEGKGWTFLKNYNGVQCYLKNEGDLTHTKGVGTIHAPPLVVAAYMTDPAHRDDYDDLYKRDTLLRELDLAQVRKHLNEASVDMCDVKYVEYKSPFPMAITARDSVLLSCRQIEKNGTVKVIMVSAPDSLHPPTAKYVRAHVFTAGIKLEPHPTEEGACLMSNVQMIDPNGSIPSWIVKTVAPERAGMSAKVDAGLSKLADLPDPLPIPHIHTD